MKIYIAIVSDEILFWNLLIPLLRRQIADVEITVCKSIQEIDSNLDAKSCDVVLVDGGMSLMSSIEVIQHLRMIKKIIAPVLFFPEINAEGYINKSLEMGASQIIYKPFDPYKVIDEIIALLKKKYKKQKS